MGYRTAVLGDERGGEKKGKKITQRITVGYLIAVEVSVESKVHRRATHDQTAGPASPISISSTSTEPKSCKRTVKSKQTCTADAGFQVRIRAHWQERVGAACITMPGDRG